MNKLARRSEKILIKAVSRIGIINDEIDKYLDGITLIQLLKLLPQIQQTNLLLFDFLKINFIK